MGVAQWPSMSLAFPCRVLWIPYDLPRMKGAHHAGLIPPSGHDTAGSSALLRSPAPAAALANQGAPFSVEVVGLVAQVGSLLEVLSDDSGFLRLVELLDPGAQLRQSSSGLCGQVRHLCLRQVPHFRLCEAEL